MLAGLHFLVDTNPPKEFVVLSFERFCDSFFIHHVHGAQHLPIVSVYHIIGISSLMLLHLRFFQKFYSFINLASLCLHCFSINHCDINSSYLRGWWRASPIKAIKFVSIGWFFYQTIVVENFRLVVGERTILVLSLRGSQHVLFFIHFSIQIVKRIYHTRATRIHTHTRLSKRSPSGVHSGIIVKTIATQNIKTQMPLINIKLGIFVRVFELQTGTDQNRPDQQIKQRRSLVRHTNTQRNRAGTI